MCSSLSYFLGNYIYYITIPPIIIFLLLGSLVLFSGMKSQINRTYFFIILSLTAWVSADSWSFILKDPTWVLWADRLSNLGLVGAALIVLFVYIFPDDKKIGKKIYAFLFAPLILLVVLVPTRYYETIGPAPMCETQAGPAYWITAILLLYYIIWGAVVIFKKLRILESVQKKQFKIVAFGAVSVLVLATIIDVFPTILSNSDIVIFAPYTTLIFAMACAYAIVKYKAFNAKLIGTEALAIFLMVLIGSLFFVNDIGTVRIVVAITLALASVVSFFLIRSVGKEIEQKEELAKVNEDLKRLDQAKSEFLNIASHQLRTPVSVIRSVASMFAAGDMENVPLEQRKKFYDSILFKSEKLETIIHDILNATSLTAKKYNVMDKSAEAINLRVLIDDIVKDFSVEVRDRELELTLLPESESVPEIRGQKEYLKEVFINLITNAIKYTPSVKQTKDVRSSRDDGGKGTIELSIENDKDTAGNVLIKVMDNGIGIPDDEKAKLFQKFQRAQNARNMYTDGTGIGLFVIKEIVEGHRGKVWFESELGKGTTFFVSLPIVQKGEVNVKEFITENATE